jgi:hypothetical protein
LFLSATGRSSAADAANGPELPEDGSVAVLELAYQDAGRQTPETVVAVHADGSVIVRDPDGVGDQHGLMTEAQLVGLLHEIVDEASMFDLDSGRIQQDVRRAAERSGRPWRVSNPGVVLVRVRLRDRQHEVRCPAAEIWHERFPGVESITRLCRIRRRLENVRAIIQAGGWDHADKLSELVNRELKRAHPEARRVTPADLSMVRGRLPGPRFVQFVSSRSTSDGETLMISVIEFPNQPVRVTIAPLSGS